MSDVHARIHILMAQDRHAEAEQVCRRALVDDPQDEYLLGCLALTLVVQGRKQEALEEVERAIGLAPDMPFLHCVRASALLSLERTRAARAAADEAIRLDPDDADNFDLHARILLVQEKWQEALEAAERGLAIDAEHVNCINHRATALTHLGRRDQAAQALKTALAEDPENARTHANQGWSLLHAGRHRQAMKSFSEALRLDPEDDWARRGLVEALKANNLFYRLMLRYMLWMTRLGQGGRWAVVIGVLCSFFVLDFLEATVPAWKWWLSPLQLAMIAFCQLTWFSDHFFNLTLRLHPLGKHALSPDQRRASTYFGIGSFAFVIVAAAIFLLGIKRGPWGLVSLLPLMFPVEGLCNTEAGRPRWIMFGALILVWACFLFCYLGPVAFILHGMDPRQHVYWFQSAYEVYFWGAVACLWGANLLNTRFR